MIRGIQCNPACPCRGSPGRPPDVVREALRRRNLRRRDAGRQPSGDPAACGGANVCRIAVHRPQGGDLLVVLSVIDNLVKGASGQTRPEHEHPVRAGRAPGPLACGPAPLIGWELQFR
ncbi:hypothetical protein ACPA9J_35875 [Pseudomonas aeruginosa]